jgi:hypothetical protein
VCVVSARSQAFLALAEDYGAQLGRRGLEVGTGRQILAGPRGSQVGCAGASSVHGTTEAGADARRRRHEAEIQEVYRSDCTLRRGVCLRGQQRRKYLKAPATVVRARMGDVSGSMGRFVGLRKATIWRCKLGLTPRNSQLLGFI